MDSESDLFATQMRLIDQAESMADSMVNPPHGVSYHRAPIGVIGLYNGIQGEALRLLTHLDKGAYPDKLGKDASWMELHVFLKVLAAALRHIGRPQTSPGG